MKKIILTVILTVFVISNKVLADGGALGLQLGGVTFGLGGSSNGPIIGVGPSPDNGLPVAFPIVPGDGCCSNGCSTNSCCSSEESYDDYYE